MFMLNYVLPLAVAAATFFANARAQNLTLNTPSGVAQCRPSLLTWTGGTAPLFLSIFPGSSPSSTLVDLGEVTGNSYTWIVRYPPGTSLGLTLRDSTGLMSQTAVFTVGNSTDTSCLNSTATSGVSGSTTTTRLSTTTTPGTITQTTKPPTANTGTTTPVTPATAVQPSSSSTSSSNKIIANSVVVSIAAAVFAILA